MWIIAEANVLDILIPAIVVLLVIGRGVAAWIKQQQAESQRKATGRQPADKQAAGAAGVRGATKDKSSDLSAFLESVRNAAQQQQEKMRRQQRPRPQPRRQPAQKQQPPSPPRRKQMDEPVVVRPTRVETPEQEEPASVEPLSRQPSSDWLARLPEQPLQRGILIQAILGPPVSRRSNPNAGPIALRR